MGMIKNILLGLITFVLIIVFGLAIAMGTIIVIFLIQVFLLSEKDYLLLVSNDIGIITVFMIESLAIYLIYKLDMKLSKGKGKLFHFESVSLINEFDGFSRYVKIIYGIVLFVFIYCGVTSYSVVYEDRIKVISPLSPSGVTYDFDDIESIDVGIKKQFRSSHVPFYKVKFSDNKVADLLGGSSNDTKDEERHENILIDLDYKLKSRGVIKSVSRVNFQKYSRGLDEEFVNRIEKLFNEE